MIATKGRTEKRKNDRTTRPVPLRGAVIGPALSFKSKGPRGFFADTRTPTVNPCAELGPSRRHGSPYSPARQTTGLGQERKSDRI
jgi:hypothetical protein